jgi:hypothetical protein
MSLRIDTVIGNKRLSPKLKKMLSDLRNNTGVLMNNIEEIKQQACKEGLSDQETKLLLKQYLVDFLTKDQIKYLLHDKGRREEQKKLTKKRGTSPLDANMSMKQEQEEKISIPTDYKIVIPAQILEEETKQLEQESESEPVNEVSEEIKPNYEIENLKMKLDNTQSSLEQALADKKNWEEKCKQLEARTRISPSNNFPAIQGNTLRIKIVVNQMFREILPLKGSRVIYANVVIDTQQNKYIRLEPL